MNRRFHLAAAALVVTALGVSLGTLAAPKGRPGATPSPAACPTPDAAKCLTPGYLDGACGLQHAQTCKPHVLSGLESNPARASAPKVKMLKPGRTDIPADVAEGAQYGYAGPKKGRALKRRGKNVLSATPLTGRILPAVDPATAAKFHRNPAWDTNGQKVTSCAEYGYELTYDWSRFVDASGACKGDARCVVDVAFLAATPGISRRKLKRRDGKDLSPQIYVSNGHSFNKNEFFGLGSRMVYAGGPGGVVDTPELTALAAELEKGKLFYTLGCNPRKGKCKASAYDDEWDFHEQLRDATKSVSPAEFAEYERRKAKMRELLAAHEAAVRAELDVMDKVPSKARRKVLPFDMVMADPLERFDTIQEFDARGESRPAREGQARRPRGQGDARRWHPHDPGPGRYRRGCPRRGGSEQVAGPRARLVERVGLVATARRARGTQAAQAGRRRHDAADRGGAQGHHAVVCFVGLQEGERQHQRGARRWAHQLPDREFSARGVGPQGPRTEELPRCRVARLRLVAGDVPRALRRAGDVLRTAAARAERVRAVDRRQVPGKGQPDRDAGPHQGHQGGGLERAGQALALQQRRGRQGQEVRRRARRVRGRGRQRLVRHGLRLQPRLGSRADREDRQGRDLRSARRAQGRRRRRRVVPRRQGLGGRRLGQGRRQRRAPADQTANDARGLAPADPRHRRVLARRRVLRPGVDRVDRRTGGEDPHARAAVHGVHRPGAGHRRRVGELGLGADFKVKGVLKSQTCSADDVTFGAEGAFIPWVKLDARAQVGIGISGLLSAGVRATLNLLTLKIPVEVSLLTRLKDVAGQMQAALKFDAKISMTLATLSGSISLYLEFLFFTEEFELFDWQGIGPVTIPLMPPLEAELPLIGMK